MNRYKIIIEYDGTNYVGWQGQKGKESIQETIENAIYKLSGEKVELMASGRTDTGVHALGQVAHFDLKKSFRPFQIMMGLNDHLMKSSIAIVASEQVDENFHSRFKAKMRHYRYDILNRRARAVLLANRVWQIPYELDIEKMKIAAKYLIGKHDFSSFRDAQCQASSPVKTIDNIKIEQNNNLISITISAKSFLQHMVRNIVGTLVLVGGNKIAPEEMEKILLAKDRKKSGPNAPACGLYLLKIDY